MQMVPTRLYHVLAMTARKTKLLEHQKEAISKLKNGSILLGGVGSGKTITSLAYFYSRELGGSLGSEYLELSNIKTPKDLYVITTARKRDSLDWEREAAQFSISNNRDASIGHILLTVDSWNNIGKYKEIKDAFFIFDEQKVVGSGAWSKAFLKITKKNNWILLTATPGDTWMDYVSIFVANGFFKNKTEFVRNHVVFNSFSNYPKIDRYLEEAKLKRLKDQILVKMRFERKTIRHNIDVIFPYDNNKMNKVVKKRWNVFKEQPIREASEACYVMRRVANTHPRRVEVVKELLEKHKKLIVFYNFDYELDILRSLSDSEDYDVAEYNGHLHEDIPHSEKWLYLVQYISGAEAWNCVETNTIIFYSQNYSYKLMIQASGRIDRMNTPFRNLYYYHFRSKAPIDLAIQSALQVKTNFNEARFLRDSKLYF